MLPLKHLENDSPNSLSAARTRSKEFIVSIPEVKSTVSVAGDVVNINLSLPVSFFKTVYEKFLKKSESDPTANSEASESLEIDVAVEKNETSEEITPKYETGDSELKPRDLDSKNVMEHDPHYQTEESLKLEVSSENANDAKDYKVLRNETRAGTSIGIDWGDHEKAEALQKQLTTTNKENSQDSSDQSCKINDICENQLENVAEPNNELNDQRKGTEGTKQEEFEISSKNSRDHAGSEVNPDSAENAVEYKAGNEQNSVEGSNGNTETGTVHPETEIMVEHGIHKNIDDKETTEYELQATGKRNEIKMDSIGQIIDKNDAQLDPQNKDTEEKLTTIEDGCASSKKTEIIDKSHCEETNINDCYTEKESTETVDVKNNEPASRFDLHGKDDEVKNSNMQDGTESSIEERNRIDLQKEIIALKESSVSKASIKDSTDRSNASADQLQSRSAFPVVKANNVRTEDVNDFEYDENANIRNSNGRSDIDPIHSQREETSVKQNDALKDNVLGSAEKNTETVVPLNSQDEDTAVEHGKKKGGIENSALDQDDLPEFQQDDAKETFSKKQNDPDIAKKSITITTDNGSETFHEDQTLHMRINIILQTSKSSREDDIAANGNAEIPFENGGEQEHNSVKVDQTPEQDISKMCSNTEVCEDENSNEKLQTNSPTVCDKNEPSRAVSVVENSVEESLEISTNQDISAENVNGGISSDTTTLNGWELHEADVKEVDLKKKPCKSVESTITESNSYNRVEETELCRENSSSADKIPEVIENVQNPSEGDESLDNSEILNVPDDVSKSKSYSLNNSCGTTSMSVTLENKGHDELENCLGVLEAGNTGSKDNHISHKIDKSDVKRKNGDHGTEFSATSNSSETFKDVSKTHDYVDNEASLSPTPLLETSSEDANINAKGENINNEALKVSSDGAVLEKLEEVSKARDAPESSPKSVKSKELSFPENERLCTSEAAQEGDQKEVLPATPAKRSARSKTLKSLSITSSESELSEAENCSGSTPPRDTDSTDYTQAKDGKSGMKEICAEIPSTPESDSKLSETVTETIDSAASSFLKVGLKTPEDERVRESKSNKSDSASRAALKDSELEGGKKGDGASDIRDAAPKRLRSKGTTLSSVPEHGQLRTSKMAKEVQQKTDLPSTPIKRSLRSKSLEPQSTTLASPAKITAQGRRSSNSSDSSVETKPSSTKQLKVKELTMAVRSSPRASPRKKVSTETPSTPKKSTTRLTSKSKSTEAEASIATRKTRGSSIEKQKL